MLSAVTEGISINKYIKTTTYRVLRNSVKLHSQIFRAFEITVFPNCEWTYSRKHLTQWFLYFLANYHFWWIWKLNYPHNISLKITGLQTKVITYPPLNWNAILMKYAKNCLFYQFYMKYEPHKCICGFHGEYSFIVHAFPRISNAL